MTDFLRVYGPLSAMSGYAKMTRAVLRMALCAGYTVQAVESDYRLSYSVHTDGRVAVEKTPPKVEIPIPDCQWDEVDHCRTTELPPGTPTVFVQLPHNLNQRCIHNDACKIGWTMGESDRLCDLWRGGCRGVDTLLVPSEWCRQAFQKALPYHDVRAFPIPVDDRIYTVHGEKLGMTQKAPFLFTSVFATNERKQWRLMMAAFCEVFAGNEDVGLAVRPSHLREVDELTAWCRSAGARVTVIRTPLSEWDMAKLYRSTDCYALPAPEGFGLPYLEAALCGVPSIALDDGGAADFVTDATGFLCPTTLHPLIGYMPNVYPPSHRFPVTDFESMKRALTAAYESRGEPLQRKAAAALARAEQFTPSALAARFRAEVESAVDSYNGTRRRLFAPRGNLYQPEDRPQVGLALGAWGDTFVSFGMALQKRDPRRPLHMIHFGMDPDIETFLQQQRRIDGVLRIAPKDRLEFEQMFHRASLSRFMYADEWRPWFAEMAGIQEEDILFTQVNQAEDQPICRWHNAEIPHGYRAWAQTQARVWGTYILLHPISTQSAKRDEHWPLWEDAIKWLLESTPYTYVLTGMGEFDAPEHDRLINLFGKTTSMFQVLALCEKARGVISTCNAVSLWTVIQDIPAIIVSNAVFNHKEDYYHRWIKAEPNTVLYQYDTLEWFERTAHEWLSERFCEERKEEVTA